LGGTAAALLGTPAALLAVNCAEEPLAHQAADEDDAAVAVELAGQVGCPKRLLSVEAGADLEEPPEGPALVCEGKELRFPPHAGGVVRA
jgi:hypothetical protein